ncbi:MAG: hypothetical protein KDD45_02145, partial [Bdellovibrionales bacterium]|nr:hypothetical protein [Bdellovibrionales bacterium]
RCGGGDQFCSCKLAFNSLKSLDKSIGGGDRDRTPDLYTAIVSLPFNKHPFLLDFPPNKHFIRSRLSKIRHS